MLSMQLVILCMQWADSVGMPTDDGVFGFTPFAEVSAASSRMQLKTCTSEVLLDCPCTYMSSVDLLVTTLTSSCRCCNLLPQMWVGRWAQLGFVSSIVVEFTSGRGTLQQLGLASPSTPVLIALCALAGGATLAGTINTVQRATSKKMSKS